MNFPHKIQKRGLLVPILVYILLMTGVVIMANMLSSCTLTVQPDGTREYRADPKFFLEAIERTAK